MKISRLLWTSAVLAIVAVCIALFLLPRHLPVPRTAGELSSDKEMQDYFFQHQSDFEALARTAFDDPSPNFIIGLNTPYADPYRTVMNQVRATWIFNGKSQGITIASEHWGDRAKNIALAYEWMPKPPSEQQTIKTIDDLMARDPSLFHKGDVFLRYQPLAENWYLVFQWPAKSSNP